jgi:hypothetical protein
MSSFESLPSQYLVDECIYRKIDVGRLKLLFTADIKPQLKVRTLEKFNLAQYNVAAAAPLKDKA